MMKIGRRVGLKAFGGFREWVRSALLLSIARVRHWIYDSGGGWDGERFFEECGFDVAWMYLGHETCEMGH